MNQEKFKDEYRERLKKIIGKKFDTTMIYSLSQVELLFGHLWGIGKPESKLTDDELMYRTKWLECRNNILNTGNAQKRNSAAEINQYDVIWNRYITEFRIVDGNK